MLIPKLDGSQPIPGLRDLTLLDFWSWAYSDVFSNVNRAVFAEFIVGSLLDAVQTVRVEWDAVDLIYRGRRIEVKSAAYLQSWDQQQLSRISFDIAKKIAWYADTNTYADEAIRSADCYVFCLYPETDRSRANILDVTSWQFFVLSTGYIEQELGDQKTLSLSRLEGMCSPADYEDVKSRVDQALR